MLGRGLESTDDQIKDQRKTMSSAMRGRLNYEVEWTKAFRRICPEDPLKNVAPPDLSTETLDVPPEEPSRSNTPFGANTR